MSQLRRERQQQREALQRINVYICQKCRRYTVTADIDEGTTPFMIGCQNDETNCRGTATSSFYPKGPKPAHIPDPQFEWYKPSDEEIAEESAAIQEYVARGGLKLRRRTAAPILLHKPSEEAKGS